MLILFISVTSTSNIGHCFPDGYLEVMVHHTSLFNNLCSSLSLLDTCTDALSHSYTTEKQICLSQHSQYNSHRPAVSAWCPRASLVAIASKLKIYNTSFSKSFLWFFQSLLIKREYIILGCDDFFFLTLLLTPRPRQPTWSWRMAPGWKGFLLGMMPL